MVELDPIVVNEPREQKTYTFSKKDIEEIANESVLERAHNQGIKVFEDIKDKNGHARFLEGDIEIEEITGVSKTFGKWSLSGTHLLIVVAVNVASGTTIPNNTILAKITLPNWINEKIVAGYVNLLDTKSATFRDSSYASQTLSAALTKESYGIAIQTGTQTFSSDKNGRISFDLLIDNE